MSLQDVFHGLLIFLTFLQGEVYIGFETGFVFAEVNSDRINWIVKKDEDQTYSIVGKSVLITNGIESYWRGRTWV